MNAQLALSPTISDRGQQRRVLIAAPTGRDAEVLSHALGEAGIDAVTCDDLAELCRRIHEGAAAVILAEEVVTPGLQSLLIDTLVAQPEWSDLPMIVMTVGQDASHRGWQLVQPANGSAHAIVLPRPVDKITLLSCVRSALQSRERQYQVRDELARRIQAEEALRDSEGRFRTLAENINQLAWMADASGWIFWYNQRWYDYTGSTLEQMQGWGWQKVHHPKYVKQVTAKFRGHIRRGVPWEDTFPLRGKDGQYCWFLSRAQPIHDDHGRVVRWLGTNTDVTREHNLQEALKEADQRKDDFLAMLGHELRNPLAPIRSGLDMLMLDADGGKRQTIKLLQEQVEHLVRLVDDLLDVSRIMRGKIQLRKETVQLANLVQRSVRTMSEKISRRQQAMEVILPDDPVWLDVDPVRLVQVIDNLLTNASKYTEVGGRIELEAQCQKTEVVIQVRDNGIGIEPKLLPRIFELFTQANRSLARAEGGLGIGLPLVQQLVKMHSGTITANSAGAGHGSTFTVRLPIVPPPNPPRKKAPKRQAAVQQRRILIVDDNVAASAMFAALLSKLGNHHVEVVHDGNSALHKTRLMHPEIVFLDIGLPGMDGYQVAREIRGDHQFDDVLLVALTGYGQEEDCHMAHEAGFDEHLVKPATIRHVKSVLAHPKLAEAHAEVEPGDKAGPGEQMPVEATFPGSAEGILRVDGQSNPSTPPRAKLRQIKHDLGNTIYALKLAVQMLADSSRSPTVVDKVTSGLTKGISALEHLVETLPSEIDIGEPSPRGD